MKIALAQFNPVVGDIVGNTRRIADIIRRGAGEGAELVVFGELSVVGYPPRDLLRKERFVAESVAAVESLAAGCTETAALVGFVRPTPGRTGQSCQNAAALLAGGRVSGVHVKALLPAYGVFDETRYFEPGGRAACIELNGHRLGLTICEDLWDAEAPGRLYGQDPLGLLAEQGAEIIINMAASPFTTGKAARREELLGRQAARCGAPIVYVNQVGGNDELIFDGGSCAVSPAGELLGRASAFAEDLLVIETSGPAGRCEAIAGEMPRLSSALKLGLRDYVSKCGFRSVVLGLSGGVDSAVVAVLAADAIGAGNVHCLAMPSRYSSDHSVADARALAAGLGCHFQLVPIEAVHAAFEQITGELLAGGNTQIADENVQARIRCVLVMAVSNAFGHLPLATGNKSELSCGYCTLYGDMAGGLAPVGDLLKTTLLKLAGQLNAEAGTERISRGILTKPPSAELKPDQLDQDKLPPYELLDQVLLRYIEQDKTAGEIISDGFEPEVVHRVIGMVDAAEYKRKQAAPVLKVSSCAFGTGRRMPIAQRYAGHGEH